MPNEQQQSTARRADQLNGFFDLARIATLSLEASTKIPGRRDHDATLDLLHRAVDMTRPWLDDVKAELQSHGHAAGVQRAPDCAKYRGHLLAELPNLIPIVVKLLAASRRSRKADPRRLQLLSTLHDVLERKIEEAMKEIERLEGRGRRRRRRKGQNLEEKMLELELGGEEAADEILRIDEEGGGGQGEGKGGEQKQDLEGDGGADESQQRRSRRGSRSSPSDKRGQHTSQHERRDSHAAARRPPRAPSKDDAKRSSDIGKLDGLTPLQRLEAKKKALTKYKELKRQTETTTTMTTTTNSAPPPPPPPTLVSGTTHSIPRSPPSPTGVYFVRAQDVGWKHVEQDSAEGRYCGHV